MKFLVLLTVIFAITLEMGEGKKGKKGGKDICKTELENQCDSKYIEIKIPADEDCPTFDGSEEFGGKGKKGKGKKGKKSTGRKGKKGGKGGKGEIGSGGESNNCTFLQAFPWLLLGGNSANSDCPTFDGSDEIGGKGKKGKGKKGKKSTGRKGKKGGKGGKGGNGSGGEFDKCAFLQENPMKVCTYCRTDDEIEAIEECSISCDRDENVTCNCEGDSTTTAAPTTTRAR